MIVNSLRIGMVCPYSLSVPGGVQQQVLSLSSTLTRRGHNVRILAPCDGPPPRSNVTPLGNSLPTSANGSVAPLAPDAASALRTIRALRDERFDVVHLHEPLAPGPTLTALTLHSQATVATFHAAGRSSSYRYLGGVLRRLLSRVDISVAVSTDAAALVRELLQHDVDEVLFNGIELPQQRGHTPVGSDINARTGIVFVGRHEERKGLHILVEALRRLDADGIRPPTTIIGEGPDTTRLMASAHDMPWVSWVGRVTDDARDQYLSSAQILCAPSLGGESFGIVLAEAMAHGAVVVASDLPGYRNVATDGLDSALCPPGDVPALASALRAVLSDAPMRQGLVSHGVQRAEQLSMDRLAARYEGLYLDAAARYRRLNRT